MSPTLRAVMLIAIILAFLTVVIMQFNQLTLAGDVSKECKKLKAESERIHNIPLKEACPVNLQFLLTGGISCTLGEMQKRYQVGQDYFHKCPSD